MEASNRKQLTALSFLIMWERRPERIEYLIKITAYKRQEWEKAQISLYWQHGKVLSQVCKRVDFYAFKKYSISWGIFQEALVSEKPDLSKNVFLTEIP